MIKKTISYVDYDGNERTEDFYFNLSKAELMDMELTTSGGMINFIKKIVDERDTTRLIELFKEIINKSYGEKSMDGKRFIKNKEVLDNFIQTEAYSELYMELIGNTDAAVEFVNGIMPRDLVEKANANKETNVISLD